MSADMPARAVMEPRRALREDELTQAQRHTAPGEGRRSVASDGLQAEAAVPWRVLLFVNRSENPGLDWTRTGLQRLLCHLMESSSPGLAVAREVPHGAPAAAADAGHPAGRVARALIGLSRECVVAGEVDESDAGYELTVAWAAHGEPISRLHLQGPSLPPLVMQAAEELIPPAPWQRELARQHPRTWRQLHNLIARLYRLPPEVAVQRLQRCFDELPAHPQFMLQRAELLYSLDATQEAEDAAVLVDQLLSADESQNPESRLAALVLLVRIAAARANLPLLRQRVDRAQALLAEHPALARCDALIAQLNGPAGYLWRELGDRQQAANCYEKAIRHAMRAGLAEMELRYRVESVQQAILPRDASRNGETLRQLMERAVEVGDFGKASSAMLSLSDEAMGHGRHREAVYWAEKALAMALPVQGRAIHRWDSRTYLAAALVAYGELERAEFVIQQQLREQRQRPIGAVPGLSLLKLQGDLLWRRGRLSEAVPHYEDMLRDQRFIAWVRWAGLVRADFVMLLALLGRIGEAVQEMDRLGEFVAPTVASRSRAAVAMAQGHREEAKQCLRAALDAARSGKPQAFELLVDLAWMHLEDGEDFDCENLLDDMTAIQVESRLTPWVELALRDRAQPVDAGHWQALRCQWPSLTRHCPTLGTAEDTQARRAGQAAPLPNLLSLLAF